MESSAADQGSDLSGARDGHPERLDRGAHPNTLIETEHLARYRWIAPLAAGRRVLDAGCGTAYGTGILAAAGASEAIGVDRAAEMLDAVRAQMPAGVTLQAADLHELPFDEDAFELITCFETLEHLEEPEKGIDELARVLAPGGLLAISSPNRDVYPEGNPHHIREYAPAELEEALGRRFSNVRLVRQHAWLASALLPDEALAASEGEIEAGVGKAAGIPAGRETFSIALASDAELPDPHPLVVLGPEVDQRESMQALQKEKDLEAKDARIGALEGELVASRQKLADAERKIVELPRLYGARAAVEGMRSSFSWRITAPLRAVKALFTRRRD